MSDTKFTKGVWEATEHLYNGSYEVSNTHSGEQICYLNQGVYNAHLIAASPEMYAMLGEIMRDVSQVNVIEIRKLLEKARGKCE